MRRVDRICLFFLGLNLEQVLGRGYRNCGGSTAFLFFFWRGSGPGTGAGRGYRKCGRSTAFFFGEGLDLEQVLAELTENAERDRDCCLQLIEGNEGVAGPFFWARRKKLKNFGQVRGRADRNCGGSTALSFSFEVGDV